MWDEPSNNEAPIIAYDVTILDADGVQKNDPVSCDGADTSIVIAKECYVPLLTLIGTNFYLKQGDLV